MRLIEVRASLDTLLGEEDRPVIPPRLAFGRTVHRVDDRLLHLRAIEDRIERRLALAGVLRHFAHELFLTRMGLGEHRGGEHQGEGDHRAGEARE
jgi:hypothetical protein